MLRWWKSAVNLSFFLSLAACRTRSSACDTRTRLCVRCVLCYQRPGSFPATPDGPNLTREEPDASVALVRDCGGRGGVTSSLPGKQRPLAVAALEDKIVQRATVAVLNCIYEEEF